MRRNLLQALILSLALIGAALAADQVAPGLSIAGLKDGSTPGQNTSPLADANAPKDLFGVWKISLSGADITVALNQSGDEISGQCKLEGANPWNGVVAGTVSGRAVWIAKAALKGRVFAAGMNPV